MHLPVLRHSRAAIWEVDLATHKWNIFASGLRNPNGLDRQHDTHELWTVVNQRDELGDNLVSDYMTSIKRGGFYGWPYSYYGQHVDKRVKDQCPDLVAKALAPDYALGSHTASLGLAFYSSDLFPPKYKSGVFIGQHGSWKRKPRRGYKVIFIPFANGQPLDTREDALTGFVNDKAKHSVFLLAAIDRKGALLVADNVGNKIWRVTPIQ